LCVGLLRLSLIAVQQREQCARVNAKEDTYNEDNNGAETANSANRDRHAAATTPILDILALAITDPSHGYPRSEMQCLIATAENCVIKHQYDDGSDNRHEHAVKVEASNASSTNSGEEERKPPTIAPTMPRTMSRKKPSPVLLTILLPMNPAIRPSMIQPMIDM
jgi:hypothetical protein